jgi:predicted RNA-binding Zn ribbon-like protein
MATDLNEPLIRKLLATVDAGLVKGLGKPVAGKMCVEAAISYALGEPHSDGPSCVEPAVRASKIALNDKPWSSAAAYDAANISRDSILTRLAEIMVRALRECGSPGCDWLYLCEEQP